MAVHRYVEDNGSAAMLATKRSVGVTSEMNLQNCVTHMPLPKANKAAHARGDVTRSPKQEYQWPHKKDTRPPNFLKIFLKSLKIEGISFSTNSSGFYGQDTMPLIL